MGIEKYFKRYYLQEKRRIQTNLPAPSDWIMKHVDGMEVMGLFIQSKSDDAVISGAQSTITRGRFIMPIDVVIDNLRILRCEADNTYISLVGEPAVPPEQAISQFKVYTANIIDISMLSGGGTS